eukprot:9622835-Karenia_brevis.AAC.1
MSSMSVEVSIAYVADGALTCCRTGDASRVPGHNVATNDSWCDTAWHLSRKEKLLFVPPAGE